MIAIQAVAYLRASQSRSTEVSMQTLTYMSGVFQNPVTNALLQPLEVLVKESLLLEEHLSKGVNIRMIPVSRCDSDAGSRDPSFSRKLETLGVNRFTQSTRGKRGKSAKHRDFKLQTDGHLLSKIP